MNNKVLSRLIFTSIAIGWFGNNTIHNIQNKNFDTIPIIDCIFFLFFIFSLIMQVKGLKNNQK